MKTFNQKVHDKQDSSRSPGRAKTTQEYSSTYSVTTKDQATASDYTQTPPVDLYATEYRKNFVNWFRDPELAGWSNWSVGPGAPIKTKTGGAPSSHVRRKEIVKEIRPTDPLCELPPPAGVRVDGLERLCDSILARPSDVPWAGGRRHYKMVPDHLKQQFSENERGMPEEEARLVALRERLRRLRDEGVDGQPLDPRVLRESAVAAPPPLPLPSETSMNRSAAAGLTSHRPVTLERYTTERTQPSVSVPISASLHANHAAAAGITRRSDPLTFSGPTLIGTEIPIQRQEQSVPSHESPQRILEYNISPPSTYNLAQQLYRKAQSRANGPPPVVG